MEANEILTASKDRTATAGPLTNVIQERVVNSYNEWDPLEEVVVGRIENSIFPPRHRYILAGAPKDTYDFLALVGGMKVRPKRWFFEPAQRELQEFVHVLQSEGVIVKRPEIVQHHRRYATPNWFSKGQTTACPRDCFLVVGNEIIESPMSWRCRYFEIHAYYRLFKGYFEQGAKWTAAPKPPLLDSLYDENYTIPTHAEPIRYITNESEVIFDAADFTRCGRDIFVCRSNTTNEAGIAWLRRHLGDGYRIHKIESSSRQPMHIDTTFVPLGPGKAMINPKYVRRDRLPAMLKKWDVFEAPDPVVVNGGFWSDHATMCSMWLNMNVLLLDEERVIVDRAQEPMIKALKRWGLKPILCSLMHFSPYGGAFHCATLDIRRRGTLQSYF